MKLDGLEDLQTLSVSDNPNLCNGEICPNIFWKTQIPPIKELHVQNTGLIDARAQDLLQDKHWPNLKILKMDRNWIMRPDFNSVSSISGLESFSISQTYLLYPTLLAAKMLRLNHLKYLNISGQVTSFQPVLHHRVKEDIFVPLCLQPGNEACTFHFPQNLSCLDLSFSGLHFSDMPPLILISDSSLQFVDLSGNFIGQFSNPY